MGRVKNSPFSERAGKESRAKDIFRKYTDRAKTYNTLGMMAGTESEPVYGEPFEEDGITYMPVRFYGNSGEESNSLGAHPIVGTQMYLFKNSEGDWEPVLSSSTENIDLQTDEDGNIINGPDIQKFHPISIRLGKSRMKASYGHTDADYKKMLNDWAAGVKDPGMLADINSMPLFKEGSDIKHIMDKVFDKSWEDNPFKIKKYTADDRKAILKKNLDEKENASKINAILAAQEENEKRDKLRALGDDAIVSYMRDQFIKQYNKDHPNRDIDIRRADEAKEDMRKHSKGWREELKVNDDLNKVLDKAKKEASNLYDMENGSYMAKKYFDEMHPEFTAEDEDIYADWKNMGGAGYPKDWQDDIDKRQRELIDTKGRDTESAHKQAITEAWRRYANNLNDTLKARKSYRRMFEDSHIKELANAWAQEHKNDVVSTGQAELTKPIIKDGKEGSGKVKIKIKKVLPKDDGTGYNTVAIPDTKDNAGPTIDFKNAFEKMPEKPKGPMLNPTEAKEADDMAKKLQAAIDSLMALGKTEEEARAMLGGAGVVSDERMKDVVQSCDTKPYYTGFDDFDYDRAYEIADNLNKQKTHSTIASALTDRKY